MAKVSYSGMTAVGFAVLLAALLVGMSACQSTGEAVRIDNDDLGGVVTSTQGPEAGVWVIAETTDLPTRFIKTVVTDDLGRYLVPDLPQANYSVWVRGYGLVDSVKVQTEPGKIVNLTAVVAPDPAAAAQYYPSNYWYSLLRVPDKSEFPGTGPNGNGISPRVKSQAQWLRSMRTDGCGGCHPMGNKATREIPENLGSFDSSVAAWGKRIQVGQAADIMTRIIVGLGRQRSLAMFADWTDRIAAGELPPVPPRPKGVERNVVISLWDWADPKGYLHDGISTDRRNPTVNANGAIYGAMEHSTDYMPVLDPVSHTASQVTIPLRDPNFPSTAETLKIPQPSPYWGEEVIWDSKVSAHNPMIDHKGRVWLTSRIRPRENPDFCKEGSSHPSAKLFPISIGGRGLSVYDAESGQFTLIDTCFPTHHLNFAEDANNTLWTSSGVGGRQVVGWLNTNLFDETGDEEASQGWTALILDTNGNGKRDAYVEPDQPVDPAMDKRIAANFYGVAPSPADGSIWGSSLGLPGSIIRLNPGSNPPATALAEIYELPLDNPKAPVQGYSPRGLDIDRDGVVWAPLASGHFASFDRRKCTGPLNGPTATGQHCPEGWTLYPFPGPHFQGVTESGSAEASYYDWVDQFDTFGLGTNVPIATGNRNGALMALVNENFVILRVPYPMGFFAKGVDGRIDDPEAGWKGKGLWTTYATRAPFHSEGGKGTPSQVVKFQLRPDPLTR